MNYKISNRLSCLLMALFLFGHAGCSSEPTDRLPTYPVTGVVRLDGKPLAKANVTLMYAELNRSSFGQTNEAGEFKLATYEDADGALAGQASISVSKWEEAELDKGPIAGEPGYDPSKAYKPQKPHKSLVPEKYSDFQKSGLSAKIEASKTNPPLKIELSSR